MCAQWVSIGISFLHVKSEDRGESESSRHPQPQLAQSVTCLAAYTCLTADPGVASSMPARSYTFMEIDDDDEVILFPSAASRRVVFSYKHKYVHEVYCLVKLAQRKCVVR